MERRTRTPEAYLITFRTYGTWLRGDPRGWSSRPTATVRAAVGHDPSANAGDAHRRSEKTFRLCAEARTVVRKAFADECAYRGWTLLASSVDDEHVHAVVIAAGPPETVLNALKTRATRRLHAAGLYGDRKRVWARHGSTVYLWNTGAVKRACCYVMGQDGEGPSRVVGAVSGTDPGMGGTDPGMGRTDPGMGGTEGAAGEAGGTTASAPVTAVPPVGEP